MTQNEPPRKLGITTWDPPMLLNDFPPPHKIYAAIGIDGLIFCSRDWRSSEYSPVQGVNTPDTPANAGAFEAMTRHVQGNADVTRTLRDLEGSCRGRTAYVVLSGPSCKRNLSANPPLPTDIVIGVNRGACWAPRCDIMLVGDRAVRRELVEGWLARAGRGSDWFLGHGTKLVMCQSSNPDLRGLFGKDDVCLFRPAGNDTEIEKCGMDRTLPELEYAFNIGSMTQHLADRLGCAEIVYVGADLCFTDGYFYPGERMSVQSIPGPDKTTVVLDDLNGHMTVTDLSMLVVARKMEAWAWMLKEYGVRCVNLTGAGILSRWFEMERRPMGMEHEEKAA